MLIRPCMYDQDEPAMYHLWQDAFSGNDSSANWPVSQAWFRSILMDDRGGQDHLIAETDGQQIGFVLIQVSQGNPTHGSILALAVHPNYRRQGVGRLLHQAALERLRMLGARHVQLGAGASSYFWPGVPADLPGAWAFFQAMGWPAVERSYDLVRPLEDYHTPAWVWERVSRLGIDFLSAGEARLEKEAIDFVAAEQPGWAASYAQAIQERRGQDVLLAVHRPSGKILAACLIESPSPRWSLRIAQPVGAPGCILTAETAQGQGIGMALTARATEIAQARGCRTGFLGWTWLVDWYGKLGYNVWQEYIMSWQDWGTICSSCGGSDRNGMASQLA